MINLDDAKIRRTEDGKVSLFDVLRVVGKIKSPTATWGRIKEHYPNTKDKVEYAVFKDTRGRRNKATPVITIEQIDYFLQRVNTVGSSSSIFQFSEIHLEQEFAKVVAGLQQVKVAEGRLDIVCSDGVVEVKRGTITCVAVGQLLRYLTATGNKEGMLVGLSIKPDAVLLIHNLNLAGWEIKFIQAASM